MEIEFPENIEGGYAEIDTGRSDRATLEVVNDNGIRLGLESMMRHGLIALGVQLDPDEARRVGRYLIAQADIIEEDRDGVEEESENSP